MANKNIHFNIICCVWKLYKTTQLTILFKFQDHLGELLIALEKKSMKIEEFVSDIESLFNSVEVIPVFFHIDFLSLYNVASKLCLTFSQCHFLCYSGLFLQSSKWLLLEGVALRGKKIAFLHNITKSNMWLANTGEKAPLILIMLIKSSLSIYI